MKSQAATEIESPEITTYDRAELTIESGFVFTQSGFGSDRKSKTSVRALSGGRILRKLASGKSEKKRDIRAPEVTTYDRAELTIETGFTGGTSNPQSDRNSKTAVRKSDGRRILSKLASGKLEKKSAIRSPEVTTYDRTELTIETGFTGTSPMADSDRNIKTTVRKMDSRRMLGRLVNIGR